MKLFKMFAFAGLMVLLGIVGAHASDYGDPCVLITEMGGVFRTLRTLAFAGAALILAGWAWTFITKGWDAEGTKLDDARKKGIGMLIGFVLLFGLGMVLQFLPQATGCVLTAFN